MGELMNIVIDASEQFAARREGIAVRYPQAADVAPIAAESAPPAAPAPDTFADTIARNKETRERMRREREDANKAVLRSYRIKS